MVSDDAPTQKAKETIRAKCVQYLERAEKLKQYLEKGPPQKTAGGEERSDKRFVHGCGAQLTVLLS